MAALKDLLLNSNSLKPPTLFKCEVESQDSFYQSLDAGVTHPNTEAWQAADSDVQRASVSTSSKGRAEQQIT